ncbi:WhiB family transcriptional regulator [Nonomuraea sp. NPDC003754]
MTQLNLHWAESAACGAQDPDVFFPLDWKTVPAAQTAEIRRICTSCPVRLPCLEWAVTTGEPDGMWAATTPADRRRMRAAQRPASPSARPPSRAHPQS